MTAAAQAIRRPATATPAAQPRRSPCARLRVPAVRLGRRVHSRRKQRFRHREVLLERRQRLGREIRDGRVRIGVRLLAELADRLAMSRDHVGHERRVELLARQLGELRVELQRLRVRLRRRGYAERLREPRGLLHRRRVIGLQAVRQLPDAAIVRALQRELAHLDLGDVGLNRFLQELRIGAVRRAHGCGERGRNAGPQWPQ